MSQAKRVAYKIPMYSADGQQRWTARPANRWGAGFQTEQDALRAAELVERADWLASSIRQHTGPTSEADRRERNELLVEIHELSMRGGLQQPEMEKPWLCMACGERFRTALEIADHTHIHEDQPEPEPARTWTIESEKEGLAGLAETQFATAVEQAKRANQNRIDRLSEIGEHTISLEDLPAVYRQATERGRAVMLRVSEGTWYAVIALRETPEQTWVLFDGEDSPTPVEDAIDPDDAPLAHIAIDE